MVERVRIEKVVAKSLVKTFGATAALRGINLELRAGELALIEGPNGSGKTTLLRILGTLLTPSSGRVSYPPFDRVEQVRGEVGWLSHEALAYGDLTGRQNIALAAEIHGLDADDTWTQAKDRFALGRFADRPLRTNSRGQRQRIALARALLHRPSLVLLDEPTTGLDRAGVERLVELIAEERDGGAVLALVSHEPELFAKVQTHRVALDRGRVVNRGE